MLGTRGVRLGILKPQLYRTQVRSLLSAARERVDAGGRPIVEIMIPLIVNRQELELVRGWVAEEIDAANAGRSEPLAVSVGSMIETPRAALRAGEIANVADFFSFGTNDLTQMTFGFSRDDVESSFIRLYCELELIGANPFDTIDQSGVGELVRQAAVAARATKPDIKLGVCGEHGGDPASIDLLLALRTRLRVVFALPGADRPARRRPGHRAVRGLTRPSPPRSSPLPIAPTHGTGKFRRWGSSMTTSSGCASSPTSSRSSPTTASSAGSAGVSPACAPSTPRSRRRSRSTAKKACTTASAAGRKATSSPSSERRNSSTSSVPSNGWPTSSVCSCTTPTPTRERSANVGPGSSMRSNGPSSSTTIVSCTAPTPGPPVATFAIGATTATSCVAIGSVGRPRDGITCPRRSGCRMRTGPTRVSAGSTETVANTTSSGAGCCSRSSTRRITRSGSAVGSCPAPTTPGST